MKKKLLANVLAVGMVLSSFMFLGNVKPENDISREAQKYENEIRYSGTSLEDAPTITETVTFDHKVIEEYSIPRDLPKYHAYIGATNCANVAGAGIIGFYDKTYENLIPNYKVYTTLGNVLVYKAQTEEIEAVIYNLSIAMGTDASQAGTTFSGFQSGMASYVSSHGYTYQSEDMFAQNAFSLSKFQTAVEAGKPVALFLPEYTIIRSIVENANSDTIKTAHSTVAHVVAACGYKIVTYYDSYGNTIAIKRYLKVATGFNAYGIKYLEIASSDIYEAIAINIY